MLSIERCRRLLGTQAEAMTDAEVVEMRDALTAFARLGIDDYLREHNQSGDTPSPR